MNKEYGLILPGKKKMLVQAPGKRAAIFDEDSDSEGSEFVKPNFSKPPEKKLAKLSQDKALEEDPTVYQYDEVYDEIEKKRNDSKLARRDLDKKPKYISNLLKAAERRKRENEMRIERQVQKEREAEGDEFKDKESYVTPSYQKKLEEMKALEEKEKYEEYLESIGDVKKQGNMDGFYRHLYDQKVNFEDKIEEKPVESTEESSKDEEKVHEKKTKKSRQYRAREQSENEEDCEEVKKEHIPSNLDADSDFSIDSSDSEDEKTPADEPKEITKTESNVEVKKEIEDEKIDEETVEEKSENVSKPVQKKPKIDIWKKRTVGKVFEEARQRYFERLALRESG